MKRLIFTLFVLHFCMALAGAPVDDERAEAVALSFMKRYALLQKFAPPRVKDHFVCRQDGFLLYHVFNLDSGWILVSGDDRFYPVLAFSGNGEFADGEKPEALQDWLSWYGIQMTAVYRGEAVAGGRYLPLWDELLRGKPKDGVRGVEPLLTGWWGQGPNYDAMCPEDSLTGSGHVPVGCVPMAMAQIMFYYRFPPRGQGAHSYLPGYGNGYYGIQSADFGNTTYHWEQMQDAIDRPNDAVAQLCYHAGVAINANYSPTGTGAQVTNVAQAFADYFKYRPDAQSLAREDFDTAGVWHQMLMASLNAGKPVLYRSSMGFAGHAYVCDGYSDSTHFHFNWGWDGRYDGYFFIDELIPGGINLSNNQGGIFGIFPDSSLVAYPYGCTSPDTLTQTVGSIADGSSIFTYETPGDCRWLIDTDPAEVNAVGINISAFGLADGDTLEIYAGSTTSDPLVAALSGNSIPETLLIGGSSSLIRFVRTSSTGGQGFRLNYYGFVLPFCSGENEVTAVEGTIDDGSGLFTYSDLQDCRWLIAPAVAPTDSVGSIACSFDSFDLGSGDTLFVFDGENENAPLLQTFTSGDEPLPFVNSGDRMYLKFCTDEAATAQGWELHYAALPPVYCHDTLWIDTPEGIISDGSNGKNYLNNMTCYWMLTSPDSVFTELSFLTFDLEWQKDFLKVYDAETQPPEILWNGTGSNIPDPVVFRNNKLLIEFTTDAAGTADGFELEHRWITMDGYCHDTTWLDMPAGSISDGSNNENYLNNSDCSWIVEVQDRDYVRVSFTGFDLEYQHDHLQVYDLRFEPPWLIQSYTGNSLPGQRVFYTNRLLFKFITDKNTTAGGFTLNYEAFSSGLPGIENDGWRISPNPVRDELLLRHESNPATISWRINDISGRMLLSGTDRLPVHIPVSHLQPGVYFLCIENTDKQSHIRFVKSN